MKTVFKYRIDLQDQQTVYLPKDATILDIQSQDQSTKLSMWALVDTSKVEEARYIEIFGTGHTIPDGIRKHIKTIQLFNGTLVYHIFEKLF